MALDRRLDPTMSGVFWSDTVKESSIDTAPDDGMARYDLVVIGGGYCGLSTALHSAKRGLRVAVVEAGRVGNGASGRNGGFVVPQFPKNVKPSDVVSHIGKKRGDRLCEIVTNGPSHVFDQVRQNQIACDAEQNGWIQPAHSEASLEKVRAVYEEWKAFGADVTWLDRSDVHDQTGAAGYLGGWKNPTGGYINPYSLSRGLARVARNQGVDIFEDTRAESIERESEHPVVIAQGRRFAASKVLVATNGYTDGLWPGLQRTVIPLRLFHTVSRPLTPDQQEKVLPGRLCFTDLRKSGGFCRYDEGSRLVSGGAVFPVGDVRRSGMSHAEARVSLYFPQLKGIEFDYYWEGYCALTETYLPSFQVLDRDVFAVLGFSTRGVALAQAIGPELARFLSEDMALDDMPLHIGENQPIPRQGLKSFLGQYAFPVLKALDRFDLS